ncbi:hypothetical protein Tco_0374878 [Tanacetum coccineum]
MSSCLALQKALPILRDQAERKAYAPSAGSRFISGFTSISRRPSKEMNFPVQAIPFGPSSYLSTQARVVVEYTMSQIILQAVTNGGANGILVVVTGASHVAYGSRGTGQYIRREGEVPVADFLWYSAARPCTRNCFDRAEMLDLQMRVVFITIFTYVLEVIALKLLTYHVNMRIKDSKVPDYGTLQPWKHARAFARASNSGPNENNTTLN